MGSLRILALAGALASVTASAATAGDLPPPVTSIPDAPIEAVSSGDDTGIYLRGDVGVGITGVDSLGVSPTGTFNTLTTSNTSISDSYIVGAGIGYAFNSWLRFDVTGEYRAGMSLRGSDRINFGAAPGNDLLNDYTGSYSSAVGLFNAYVDLGTFCQLGCITPYVGAGIGYGYSWASGVMDDGMIQIGGAGAFTSTRGYGSGEGGDLAWAIMAGAAYKVNEKLTLDLGYRYLNLGDSPAVNITNAVSGAADGSVTWRNIDSHDIRLGMRWMLGGADCCGAEVPISRKY